jgi:hypothetical protein
MTGIENIPRFESEEEELRSLLQELHEDHQRRITPIIRRLYEIDVNRQQLDQLLARFKR